MGMLVIVVWLRVFKSRLSISPCVSNLICNFLSQEKKQLQELGLLGWEWIWSMATKWHPVPFTGFVPFFRNKFPGLFQDSDWFFQDSKIHINPFTPKISMFILLTVCHTFHIFYLSLTDFQNFPGPVALFQDFPVLENAAVKFQDLPGFPALVRTLLLKSITIGHFRVAFCLCQNESFIWKCVLPRGSF